MNVFASAWNLAATALVVVSIVVTVRRPASRWTRGRYGKLLSVLAAVALTCTWGRLSIPFGAVIVLLRHRHDQAAVEDVGMAEQWPW